METMIRPETINVDAFTSPDPICISQDTYVERAIEIMQENEVRHLPVRDEVGSIVGVLSKRELVPYIKENGLGKTFVKEVMAQDPISVVVGTPLFEAAFSLADNRIGSLLINDMDGNLVGIFTRSDALNALVEVIRGDILELD